MGMADNPLIGDYTKGIAKGAQYFANLQARARRERFPLRKIAQDLQNPLLQMIQKRTTVAELIPRHLDQLARPKAVDLPVDKSKKRAWKTVTISELACLFGKVSVV
jgi:hypothetical protein